MKELPLTKGFVAIVDDADFPEVSKYKWCACGKDDHVYAVRAKVVNGKRTVVYMHREILGAEPGQYVDHANGIRTDNRRENIRICTQQQNLANVTKTRGNSKYKGVSYLGHVRKWSARIRGEGYLGLFETEEEAARAYDEAAHRKNPEHSRPNFPDQIGINPPIYNKRKLNRITEDQAREIIARLDQNESATRIARDLGVTVSNVNNIKHGGTWSHLRKQAPPSSEAA